MDPSDERGILFHVLFSKKKKKLSFLYFISSPEMVFATFHSPLPRHVKEGKNVQGHKPGNQNDLETYLFDFTDWLILRNYGMQKNYVAF